MAVDRWIYWGLGLGGAGYGSNHGKRLQREREKARGQSEIKETRSVGRRGGNNQ